ncbi:hypothetical protein AAG570_013862 [Ranatra chinensis]|uniref:Uncharacterized protein n=1 Tax=Ranatra chinensis TaxID=642074 RepID=A0ABD0YDD6_9HEMI
MEHDNKKEFFYVFFVGPKCPNGGGRAEGPGSTGQMSPEDVACLSSVQAGFHESGLIRVQERPRGPPAASPRARTELLLSQVHTPTAFQPPLLRADQMKAISELVTWRKIKARIRVLNRGPLRSASCRRLAAWAPPWYAPIYQLAKELPRPNWALCPGVRALDSYAPTHPSSPLFTV